MWNEAVATLCTFLRGRKKSSNSIYTQTQTTCPLNRRKAHLFSNYVKLATIYNLWKKNIYDRDDWRIISLLNKSGIVSLLNWRQKNTTYLTQCGLSIGIALTPKMMAKFVWPLNIYLHLAVSWISSPWPNG